MNGAIHPTLSINKKKTAKILPKLQVSLNLIKLQIIKHGILE